MPPGEKFKGFFPICLRGNFVLPTGASCYFASLRFLLGHHATKPKDPISISQDDKPPAPTVIQKNYEPSSALMEEVDYKSRLWHRHKNTRKQKTGKKERWRNTCIWFVRLTNCSHWGQICWNSNPEVSPPGWAQSQCHYHSYNEEKSVNYFIQWPCKQQELLHNKSAIRHAGLEGGHTNIVVPQLVNNRGCDLLIECLMLQRDCCDVCTLYNHTPSIRLWDFLSAKFTFWPKQVSWPKCPLDFDISWIQEEFNKKINSDS